MPNANGVRDLTETVTITAFAARSGAADVVVCENGLVKVNDIPVSCTKSEHAMLYALAKTRGQVMTARMLLTALYFGEEEPEMKILDVFVCKIRNKLHTAHPDADGVLKTEWGRGYAFGEPPALAIPAPGQLPSNGTRWVIARKAQVVEALLRGQVTEDDVLSFYPNLSAAELGEWRDAFARHGHAGLRITRTQIYQRAAAA